MRTRMPAYQEIEELVAFLPRLYSEGFKPVTEWSGGTREKGGYIHLPWPEYNPVVIDFFRCAAGDCWMDYDYRPEEAAQMLSNEELIRSASLSQIKTMLTFCVRGERFADGHWAEMIEKGYIRKILERLIQLSRCSKEDRGELIG